MNSLPLNFPSEPISLGAATRAVVIECIRKWAVGAALDERERRILDEALALNRLDMLQTVFTDREDANAQG